MTTQSRDRFDDNNFTVFRLTLALLVVFGHFRIFVGQTHYPWPYGYAATAVECFFVVSGYLVTHSFDRDQNLLSFYTRRIFRIYPLYLAVVVAQTVALGFLAPAGFIANAHSLIRYFLVNAVFANFLQYDVGQGALTSLFDANLNPSLWTLKLEVAFYLILPGIWWAVRRYGVVTLILIFVASAVYFAVLDRTDHYRLAKQLPGQMQFFVVGIAAYLYRQRLPTLRPATGLAITVVLGALVTVMSRTYQPGLYPICVGLFVIAAALYTPRVRLRRDISYGVYLLHAPIIQISLLLGLYRPDWIGLTAVIAIVLPLATVAERVIEAPGIALGKRLSRQFGKRQSSEPASGPSHPQSPNIALPGINAVIVNDFCYVQGGASKVAIDEAIGLARTGVNVTFIGAVGPPCPALRDAPVTVECLNQRELLDFARHPSVALQALWNVAAARRVRTILRNLPPERTVVHVHGYTKALSASPVHVAKALGFRVVCTLHDFFLACPNGAFFNYRTGLPCPKRGLSAGCIATSCDKRHYSHKAFRVARGVLQRWWGRFPATVKHYIPLSRKSAAILSPYLPRDAALHPTTQIVDAVPTSPVQVASNRELICVGRLDTEKGVRMLAEAVRDLGLKITFVGDGPLRSEIETIAGATVTGWVSSDRVKEYLAGARCLVFPSLWYETYGLVVAEAAARGIPAIVSDISAAAERVQNGVTGWHFRSGDQADLARCLKLLDDDATVAAAGATAFRAFWENPETHEAHAEGLLRVYREVLAV